MISVIETLSLCYELGKCLKKSRCGHGGKLHGFWQGMCGAVNSGQSRLITS